MTVYNFDKNEHGVVEFNNELHPRIQICPMYYKLGFSPYPNIFGRYTVLDRLLKALDFIPQEYGFLIWDVYRPRSVQKILFNWMREEIKKSLPQLSDEENYDEAKKYMSPPSNIGDEYCPPHLSGGAIDITLYDLSCQKELEMGTAFDDCTQRAHRDFFNNKVLTNEEKEIKHRRDLLRTAMEKVGFTSYDYEWWHFDIGNIFWSRAVEQPTVFGPLFADREWPVEEHK